MASGQVYNGTVYVDLLDFDRHISTNIEAYQIKIISDSPNADVKGTFIMNTHKGKAEFKYLMFEAKPGQKGTLFHAEAKEIIQQFSAADLNQLQIVEKVDFTVDM